jgi:hypothetical protein
MIVKELERMRKTAVMASFNCYAIIFRDTEQNHENSSVAHLQTENTTRMQAAQTQISETSDG